MSEKFNIPKREFIMSEIFNIPKRNEGYKYVFKEDTDFTCIGIKGGQCVDTASFDCTKFTDSTFSSTFCTDSSYASYAEKCQKSCGVC